MPRIGAAAVRLLLGIGLLSGCARPHQAEPAAQVLSFSLAEYMEANTHHFAPPDIVAQLLRIEKDGLDDDKRQFLWSDEKELFEAVPIDLNGDGITDYLVCPAGYLPSQCGAHSISLWLFVGERDGTHRLVLGGVRMDEVRILPQKTQGLRDVDLIYGMIPEHYLYCYDGREYREVPAARTIPSQGGDGDSTPRRGP